MMGSYKSLLTAITTFCLPSVMMAVGFGVLLIVFVGFLLMMLKNNAKEKAEIEAKRAELRQKQASASAALLTPSPSVTLTPTQVSPAEIASQAASLKVIILNGSGVTGQANVAKSEFEKLGFVTVETGNSPTLTSTTTPVVVSASVSSEVRQLVLDSLKQMGYTPLLTQSSEITDDIRVTLSKRSAPTPELPLSDIVTTP